QAGQPVESSSPAKTSMIMEHQTIGIEYGKGINVTGIHRIRVRSPHHDRRLCSGPPGWQKSISFTF
ncbi:MAG TPA: hypothetical protein VHS96_00105, partial [Bacteroidia bacterium]|nr:hypothetical protein [Bacteroidia bacterium]